MAKVVGPGSLIVDITGFAPRLPVAGETVKGRTVRFGPGGKGSNQMTAAHRAGAEVTIISCRGDDFLGQVLRDHYAREGMTEKFVAVRPGAETASALIEIDERDAQNRIIVVFAANEFVGREAVLAAEAEFADCDAVLTQFETTQEAVFAAKELAQKYRKPFILNPAPYLPMPGRLFEGVDYLTPNEHEAGALTGVKVTDGASCREAAKRLTDMGVKNAVITLGDKGVYCYGEAGEIRLDAIPVKAVETTGAGDAFNGGFACALAGGADVESALRFATCTAAISVTRLGSSPSMPYREEILSLMEETYGPQALQNGLSRL